jgi:hypothetical protein
MVGFGGFPAINLMSLLSHTTVIIFSQSGTVHTLTRKTITTSQLSMGKFRKAPSKATVKNQGKASNNKPTTENSSAPSDTSQKSHSTDPENGAPTQKRPRVTIETVSDEDETPEEELGETFCYFVDVN